MTLPSQGASEPEAHISSIVSALADPDRLKVLSAVVLGHTDVAGISQGSGLSSQVVIRSLSRLINAGLVAESPSGYQANEAAKAMKKALYRASAEAKEEFPGVEESMATELRKFFRAGRLLEIPTSRMSRLAVLDYLSWAFEPGQYYPERLVNALIRRYHPDHATLRRYLVDEGFLERKAGQYWRAGGSVQID
ncbi:MAG: DUF2087 domain-containing protein [Actinobacteria bacterium]|nr:DUF2087 domain-containing protein [Actinomycetota bacterium]